MRYNNPCKAEQRVRAFENVHKCKSILDLPSPELGSIIYLMKNGFINSNTHIVIVERHLKSMKKIQSKMLRLGFVNVKYHLGELTDCPFHGPFDLVNLDTCSTMSMDILNWIKKLHLRDGAIVALWVTIFRNNGEFKKRLEKVFFSSKEGIDLRDKFRKESGLGISFMRNNPDLMLVSCGLKFSLNDKYETFPQIPWTYQENINPMFVSVMRVTPLRERSVCQKELTRGLNDAVLYSPKTPIPSTGRTMSKVVTPALIDAILSKSKGKEAHVKFMLGKHLRGTSGKERIQKKAAYKAAASRQADQEETVLVAHNIIDNI